jgi:His/Glu/Gln/Arg/opine family amino acid ABC transporter permease subunit
MLQTFFNLDIIQAAWRIILAGLGNTVLLSLIVVPLGLLGGLILSLLAGVRNPWLRWPLMAWVDFFRAFPPLVLLIFLFAGLPFAGLELGGFACVCIAFFLNTGAYYGEILPPIQHARGREAHFARQRGCHARAAVPGAAGAERDLQSHAHRCCRAHLLCDAVAIGAPAEPAREPRSRARLAGT